MRLSTAILCMALGGCSYDAKVLESPAERVATSYGSAVPGTWLLVADGSALDAKASFKGAVCAGFSYPINASAAFPSSAKGTLSQLVERLEPANGPVSAKQAGVRGASGVITIRGLELRPHIQPRMGWITGSVEARIIVIVELTVDGSEGRLLGATVEGEGIATSASGIACEGGADAVAQATSQATRDVMRKIGEAISNSERVRMAAG